MEKSTSCFFSLIFMVLYASVVTGDIEIRQVNADISWIVEGVATYEHGGSIPKIFKFHCTSTSNNGNGLTWGRNDVELTKSQSVITGGISLNFDSPVANDAGIYICSDSNSNDDDAVLNITADNPAANAKQSSVITFIGDTVTIVMYASSISPLTESAITWKLNDVMIVNGEYQNTKRELTISNVEMSDAGEYKMVVVLNSGMFASSAAAYTNLTVLEPPVIITHPSDVQDDEWNTVQFSCNVSGSTPINIIWMKENGNVSESATTANTNIGDNIVQSILTISDVRVSDSGLYYCRASYIDGIHFNISNSAQLTIKANIRFSHTPSGETSELISDFLYVNLSFSLDCEGSGTHQWKGPNDSVISVNSTDIPYQLNINSYQRLSFSTYSSSLDGQYTCQSDNTSRSVYITNANPAVFTSKSEIRVGRITNTIIDVLVDGNPIPTANDIEWFFNGSIVSNNEYYQLNNGNKQLRIINASSDNVTGVYQCKVTTSIGNNSVYVIVSYHDPPTVVTYPKVQTVITGESVSFICNATSDLEFTITWFYEEDKGKLPVGVFSNDEELTIPISDKSHAGTYVCEVSDLDMVLTVTQSVQLLVKYPPVPSVGITDDKHTSLTGIYKEGEIPPTFVCSSEGYPLPSLKWEYNGGSLPEHVNQLHVSNVVQLTWTKALLHNDEGIYSCVAENELNTSTAQLHIKVKAVPIISSIYPTIPVTFNTSEPLITYAVPSSFSGDALTCVARGWPEPFIYWVNSDGIIINPTYIIRSSGVVLAMLNWNKNLLSGPVECRTGNEYGNISQTVQLIEGDLSRTPVSIPDPPENKAVMIRLKLVVEDCQEVNDAELSKLESSLTHVILSSCQLCENISITMTDSKCEELDVKSGLIFAGTISTESTDLTKKAYKSLSDWLVTNPLLFLNNIVFEVDSECNLLIQESESRFMCVDDNISVTSSATQTLTTTTIPTTSMPATSETNYSSFTVVWIVIVAVIGLLLAVVVITLFVVMCLCLKSLHNRKIENGNEAEVAWTGSSTTSLRTLRTNSTAGTRQDMDTSFRTNQLNSTSSDSTNGMIENPEYFLGQHIETLTRNCLEHSNNKYVRQLPTTPDDYVDYPPPQNQPSHLAFHNPLSGTSRGRLLSHQSEESLRSSTPLNEKLYQPLEVKQDEHVYAQIRPTAERESTPNMDSPPPRVLEVEVFDNPYQEPDIPTRVTLPRDSRTLPMTSSPSRGEQRSSIHYTEPIPKNQPVKMDTGLRGNLKQTTTSSTPVLLPFPYSEPVSSTSNLRTAGTRPTLPPMLAPRLPNTNKQLNRAISAPMVQPIVQETPFHHLTTLDEGEKMGNTSQPWYYDADSDIVTPTKHTDINPYAVTPNSQIEPSPYSQPSDLQSNVSSQSSNISALRQPVHFRTYQV